MAKRRYIEHAPIIADRVRAIEGRGFSFIPNRFLQDGFVASLEPDELLLYFFLVMASDRCGMSFYHYDSICSLLRMSLEHYVGARNSLIDKELIAFDGSRFQVLSLPESPIRSKPLQKSEDFENEDRATVRSILERSLGGG